jgi:hypothetical protein
MSNGLNGISPQVMLTTGPGRIVVILVPRNAGTVTPGFATFTVW